MLKRPTRHLVDRLLLAAAVLLVGITLAGPASADLIPTEVAACEHRIEGTPCNTRSITAGTCQPDTCSRLNYRVPNGPKTETYDCLRCERATIDIITSPFSLACTGGSLLLGGLLAFFVYRRRKNPYADGDYI